MRGQVWLGRGVYKSDVQDVVYRGRGVSSSEVSVVKSNCRKFVGRVFVCVGVVGWVVRGE